jgi:hypothetical protein
VPDPAVFISHASQDKSFAEGLCREIELHGMCCWMAPRDIPPGQDWAESIATAIRKVATVVVVASKDANASNNVRDEVSFALDAKRRVIVYRIDDSPPGDGLALRLNRLQSFSGGSTPDEALGSAGLENLLAALRESDESTTARRPAKRKPKQAAVVTSSAAGGAVSAVAPPLRIEPPPLDNPYSIAAEANEVTFKGRQNEIAELLSAVRSGTHTAIFGLQRMGKTSLVQKGVVDAIASSDLQGKVLVATVDLQKVGEQLRYRDFVEKVLRAIGTTVNDDPTIVHTEELTRVMKALFEFDAFQHGDRRQFFDLFQNILFKMAARVDRHIVLFLDEFSEVRRAIERSATLDKNAPSREREVPAHLLYLDALFMRHLSSLMKAAELRRKLTIFVAARPFMAEYDERRDLQLLKLMQPLTLSHLDVTAARALITEPLSGSLRYDAAAVEYLCAVTACHPYLLQIFLNRVVASVGREARRAVTLDDVLAIERTVLGDGAGFRAHFDVLVSDYSVDEVETKAEADLGHGTLAVIARSTDDRENSAVLAHKIVQQLIEFEVPEDKAWSLLAQLQRTRIIKECELDGELAYAIVIPLLRKRLVRQNVYQQYFARRKRRLASTS